MHTIRTYSPDKNGIKFCVASTFEVQMISFLHFFVVPLPAQREGGGHGIYKRHVLLVCSFVR